MVGKNNPQKKEKDKNEDCEKCSEYLAGWQRAKADYANLQKETEKRMSEFRQYAVTDLLEQLFPLVDYFKQGFAQVPAGEKDSAWLKGIEHIRDNLQKILADQGIEEIKTKKGEKFNPAWHEAVKGEGEEIVQEVSTGFKLNGKILRPVKVIIK